MIVLLNKPWGVLSQFTDRGVPARRTLVEFGLPTGVYAAGRLDQDSEGLLLLTDDGALIHRIADSRAYWPKTYLVQIEGVPDASALQCLRDGVELNGGRTQPVEVCALPQAPDGLRLRDPPVGFRKSVPDAWLEITLREGRNRQMRRMTAAVGLPTLRLIRTHIGNYAQDGLTPGETRVVDATSAQGSRDKPSARKKLLR
ncbi:MAG: pseudouridine synthase [Rhodanobacteraceae bacterium]